VEAPLTFLQRKVTKEFCFSKVIFCAITQCLAAKTTVKNCANAFGLASQFLPLSLTKSGFSFRERKGVEIGEARSLVNVSAARRYAERGIWGKEG
jgi:hypothetical protein